MIIVPVDTAPDVGCVQLMAIHVNAALAVGVVTAQDAVSAIPVGVVRLVVAMRLVIAHLIPALMAVVRVVQILAVPMGSIL